jgi:replicative DNA helicase
MLDIEKIVLGLLIKRGGDDSILEIKTEYFQNLRNQSVFDCIKQLFIDGKTIDVATVGIETKNASYAVELSEYSNMSIGTKEELDKFITELKKNYAKRKMTQAMKRAYNTIKESGVMEAKTELSAALDEIDIKDSRERPRPLKTSLMRTMDWLENQFRLREKEMLLTTGLPTLNKTIGGLMPKDLIFIGARPSVGKTAFSMDIARHIARKGRRTLFVSLEMSDIALCTRYLAGETKMDMQKIRTGQLEDKDWPVLAQAMARLSKYDIVIDDMSRKVSEIKINAKEMKSSGGLDLIVVDYIQLLQPEGRNQTREQEVSSLSRDLKAVARELDVPVMALTQLKREAEGRRPILSDLRESGGQEQDADLVLFLWEPNEDDLEKAKEYDMVLAKRKTDEQDGRLLELVVAKQRNGPLGAMYMAYFPAQTKFIELSMREESS